VLPPPKTMPSSSYEPQHRSPSTQGQERGGWREVVVRGEEGSDAPVVVVVSRDLEAVEV